MEIVVAYIYNNYKAVEIMDQSWKRKRVISKAITIHEILFVLL